MNMANKKILILVVSSLDPPYLEMINTSCNTWDKVIVDNCETIYYFGDPIKENARGWMADYENKMLHCKSIKETYSNMGVKMLLAFDWALKNKDFDYVVRVNSSCYVDKKQLVKYIETLPDNNLFAGVEVDKGTDYEMNWCWGGCQFILSKDVVQKVVENKHLFNHNHIEDVALSHVVSKLGIPFYSGKASSINKQVDGWLLLTYGGGEQKEFKDFSEIKDCEEHFYRVKHDPDRSVDKFVMEQLYSVLK